MKDKEKAQAVARIARTLEEAVDERSIGLALCRLWDEAFEAGRLTALDEFQDRFCVCMK